MIPTEAYDIVAGADTLLLLHSGYRVTCARQGSDVAAVVVEMFGRSAWGRVSYSVRGEPAAVTEAQKRGSR